MIALTNFKFEILRNLQSNFIVVKILLLKLG